MAKMAKYANYQKLCDYIFVIFTILWIVTRIGVYPFWIIYRYVSMLYLCSIQLNIWMQIDPNLLCVTAHL